MYDYHVALWVNDDGDECRLDFYVCAEDESDAKAEAVSELPKGAKLIKVINIERR